MLYKKRNTISILLILSLVITLITPATFVNASDNTFYVYAWVIDENGKSYTKTQYEPGFIVHEGFPSHETVNSYGSAIIGIEKSSTNKYNYFVYGIDDIYEKGSQSFTITENYSILKVELATIASNKKTKYTLITPGDPSYPADPLNPSNEAENKINIKGYVRNKDGGVPNAVVSIKNPSKFPEELFTITTKTDSNGAYLLTGVDEKRFGTAWLSASKDNTLIHTTDNKEFYSNGNFPTWDQKKDYNFYKGDLDLGPRRTVTVTGGTASPSTAYKGDTVTITASDIPDKKFEKWISTDGIAFKQETSQITSFVMPEKEVQITAVFSDNPDGTKESSLAVTGNNSFTYSPSLNNQEFLVTGTQWSELPVVTAKLYDSEKVEKQSIAVAMAFADGAERKYNGTANFNLAGLDVGQYMVEVSASNGSKLVTSKYDITIEKADYINMPGKTIYIKNGEECTGKINISDIFITVPEDAKFTTLSVASGPAVKSITINNNDSKVIDYISRNNALGTVALIK